MKRTLAIIGLVLLNAALLPVDWWMMSKGGTVTPIGKVFTLVLLHCILSAIGIATCRYLSRRGYPKP